MKNKALWALILGTTLAVAGCSSSSKEDFDEDAEEAISEELPIADTDVLPEETIEDLDESIPEDGTLDEEIAYTEPENFESEELIEPEYAEPEPVIPAEEPMNDSFEETPQEAPGVAAAGLDSFDSSGESESYTVQQGDTLMKIAFETYGDLYRWRQIYEQNQDRIVDPNNLSAGTVIQLEKPANPVAIDRNGDPYLIKTGDTLGTISKDIYGTQRKWKRLWQNNTQLIKDPNKIYAGFYLYYTFTPEDQREKETYLSDPLASSPSNNPATTPATETVEEVTPREPASTAPAQTTTPSTPQIEVDSNTGPGGIEVQ